MTGVQTCALPILIIPVYNQEKFLGRCLRSILDQKIDRNDYEIIVINDGSKDKTSKILNFYKKEIKKKLIYA